MRVWLHTDPRRRRTAMRTAVFDAVVMNAAGSAGIIGMSSMPGIHAAAIQAVARANIGHALRAMRRVQRPDGLRNHGNCTGRQRPVEACGIPAVGRDAGTDMSHRAANNDWAIGRGHRRIVQCLFLSAVEMRCKIVVIMHGKRGAQHERRTARDSVRRMASHGALAQRLLRTVYYTVTQRLLQQCLLQLCTISHSERYRTAPLIETVRRPRSHVPPNSHDPARTTP